MATMISNSKQLEVAKTVLATLYKEIFDREHEALFKLTYELIEDSEAAEEILIESFTSILETAFKMFQTDEITTLLNQKIQESCQNHIAEQEAQKEYALHQDHVIDADNANEEEIRKAVFAALDKLHPDRKKILLQTLQSGATVKMVADNNQMDKEKVEAYNWYTIQILRRLFFGKK
jgi:DNA-directed RNA polymerase specialized sigma24 family protein